MRSLQTTPFLFLLTAAPRLATALTFQNPATWSNRRSLFSLFNSPPPQSPKDGGSGDTWDADVDYDKEWVEQNQKSSVDPATSWDALPEITNDDYPKLGIDIGKQLQPLTAKEAAELKADATKVVNDAIDAGIDDIETLRIQMKKELESNRKAQQFAAERNAQQKSDELMTKIDKLTGDFLASTQTTRESTKIAAQASRAMESSNNQGVEMGTWGTLGGMAVIAGGLTESSTLLGSVENAKRQASTLQENRIIVIADSKQVRTLSCLGLPLLDNSNPDS
jgi:Fe-S cluster assembly scaffold protein SufB